MSDLIHDSQSIIKNIIGYYENSFDRAEFILNFSSFGKTPKDPPFIKDIAPSVVAVALFGGVHRKIDCSGLIIDWDGVTCDATILTSARLLGFPEKYRKSFNIFVRLPNGKLLLGRDDYINYNHNLMTIKIKSDKKLPVVELKFADKDIVEGMSVFALGRDFFRCTLFWSCGELHQDYPYFGCEGLSSSTCALREAGEGGPLITSNGSVCGINFSDTVCAYPLPIPIFFPCLNAWRSHGTAVWPWFGLTILDLRQLPYSVLERADLPLGEMRVIVKKVCKDSLAGQLGVRPGYFVTSCDGCDIFSAEQYSKILVQIANDMNASVGCSDTRPHQVVVQSSGCDENGEEIIVDVESVAVNDRRFWYCWHVNEELWYVEPLVGSQTFYPRNPWTEDFMPELPLPPMKWSL